MTAPMKSRSLRLQKLALSKETLANLTADEAELATGGKAGKPKTKPLPRTLGPTCDPPSLPVNCHPFTVNYPCHYP